MKQPKALTIRGYPVEESLGGMLSQIVRILNPWFDLTMQEFGITYGTWPYMRELLKGDGISQRELAKRVGSSPPTALAAIRALEAIGYVASTADASDRRRIIVHLTQKGRAVEREIIPCVASMNPQVLKGLTKSEVAALFRMLQTINANAVRALAERQNATDGDAA